MANQTITLAITGASGIQYGIKLLECLLRDKQEVHLLISNAAQIVAKIETPWEIPSQSDKVQHYFSTLFGTDPKLLNVYSKDQWTAPIASGSSVSRAMVVCPCSSSTMASIAHGLSNNLIERAADVVLKERQKLIIVSRETPLSNIHLENMNILSRAGAIIMPASPGFYHQPETIDDLINFMVARILEHLDIKHDLLPAWGT